MISFFSLKKKSFKYKHLRNTFYFFQLGKEKSKVYLKEAIPPEGSWGFLTQHHDVQIQSEWLLLVHSLFPVKKKARRYSKAYVSKFCEQFLRKRRQISAAGAPCKQIYIKITSSLTMEKMPTCLHIWLIQELSAYHCSHAYIWSFSLWHTGKTRSWDQSQYSVKCSFNHQLRA